MITTFKRFNESCGNGYNNTAKNIMSLMSKWDKNKLIETYTELFGHSPDSDKTTDIKNTIKTKFIELRASNKIGAIKKYFTEELDMNSLKESKIEDLRYEEQCELSDKIKNADQYKVDGKIDGSKITNKNDKKIFDKIYDKYDKLISPLLKENVETNNTHDLIDTIENDILKIGENVCTILNGDVVSDWADKDLENKFDPSIWITINIQNAQYETILNTFIIEAEKFDWFKNVDIDVLGGDNNEWILSIGLTFMTIDNF